MSSDGLVVRTSGQQQYAAAERARTALNSGLRDWSAQRDVLGADELGANPFRRVPRGWPDVTAARLVIEAEHAAVLDAAGARAEVSRLWWSGIAKLLGAAVSVGIPLALLVSLVVGE